MAKQPLIAAAIAAIENNDQDATMDEPKDITSAPHTGSILVYYDHAADPGQDPEDPRKLTAYAANAEALSHLHGRGFAVVQWQAGYHEEDEYSGELYWVPGCWVLDDGIFETVVNALRWWKLPNITWSESEGVR